MRTFQIYSGSSFQVYDTVSLAIITMLYLRSPGLVHPISGSLYPLTNIPLSPIHHSSLCFWVQLFLDSTYKWDHIVLVFLCLTYFTEHNTFKVHPCCRTQQDFLLSCGWILFRCLYIYIYIAYRYYFLLFIYLWLRWVFVVARRLSLAVESGGYSSLRCVGFSLRWLLLLRSTGSRHVGFSSCGSRAQ